MLSRSWNGHWNLLTMSWVIRNKNKSHWKSLWKLKNNKFYHYNQIYRAWNKRIRVDNISWNTNFNKPKSSYRDSEMISKKNLWKTLSLLRSMLSSMWNWEKPRLNSNSWSRSPKRILLLSNKRNYKSILWLGIMKIKSSHSTKLSIVWDKFRKT